MKTLQTLTFILPLGLFSCNGKTENAATKNENILSDTQVSVLVPDTAKKFVTDDYSVTNKMLAANTSDNSLHKQSGQTFSYDKFWFSNDTLKQTLVFELYTDYHRMATFHFLNNDIPTDLIHRMELHIDSGEPASEQQKLKDFDGYLKQTTKINSSYFITEKGFRLGDTKQKAIETYGKPDKQTITDGIEKLEWMFIGDTFYDGKTYLKGKPLAENSFGHQVVMYFRNGKLTGQILYNDIP